MPFHGEVPNNFSNEEAHAPEEGDAERLSVEEAQAEAELLQYYAEKGHKFLYGGSIAAQLAGEIPQNMPPISAQEYDIANRFLRSLDEGDKSDFITRVRRTFYRKIAPTIFPNNEKHD